MGALRHGRWPAAVVVVLGAVGCGGDGSSGGSSEQAKGVAEIRRAVAVMQRKGTAEATIDVSSSGVSVRGVGIKYQAAGVVDFGNDRAKFTVRVDEAPGEAAGSSQDPFYEGTSQYSRAAGRGRYEPEESGSAVKSVGDRFRYLPTDADGVHRAGTKIAAERRCSVYEGDIVLARVLARAPAARRAQLARQAGDVKRNAFAICIDGGGVIREYREDVGLRDGPSGIRTIYRFMRVGKPRSLRALGPDEKA